MLGGRSSVDTAGKIYGGWNTLSRRDGGGVKAERMLFDSLSVSKILLHT